jgi:hypothetical protein
MMISSLPHRYIPCYPCPVVDDDAILGDGSVRLTTEEDKVMLGAVSAFNPVNLKSGQQEN